MLECLLVLLVLLAGFFFFFDFATGVATRLLMEHAAARAARADAVGFNSFHRDKTVRVALIPVSGARLVPDGGRVVGSGAKELAYVRTYLQSESWPDARGILDYERWSRLRHRVTRQGDLCRASVTFGVPELLPPALGRFFGVESMSKDGWRTLEATWQIEDHASTYLRR